MSRPWEEARRRLETASRAVDALRLETGAVPDAPDADAGSAGLRAALDQARRALEERSRDLEGARARARQLEIERDQLLRAEAERPSESSEERALKAEGELKSLREANGGLNGRVSLLQAEIVRLESLRRKAEEAGAQGEQTRRQLEESMRRELRSAHAALDRAAAEGGAREARMQGDLQSLQRRLEAALSRADLMTKDQRSERERYRAERERLATTLQRSSAVHAALRAELKDLRAAFDVRVDEELKRRIGEPPLPPKPEFVAAASPVPTADPAQAADPVPVPAPAPRVAAPPAESAALVRRLRPAASAAYERLRELSASVPLSDTERASLRRAASALLGLRDAVALVERYLDEGPAGSLASLEPALERASDDWSLALERKGCRLALTLEPGLPDAVHDAADLRLLLDQLLRGAFEALPAGCALSLGARRGESGVELILEDDGPALPRRLGAKAFEPLQEASGRLGLGLAFARRAARRWGGDARLEKSSAGGVRVVLTLKTR